MAWISGYSPTSTSYGLSSSYTTLQSAIDRGLSVYKLLLSNWGRAYPTNGTTVGNPPVPGSDPYLEQFPAAGTALTGTLQATDDVLKFASGMAIAAESEVSEVSVSSLAAFNGSTLVSQETVLSVERPILYPLIGPIRLMSINRFSFPYKASGVAGLGNNLPPFYGESGVLTQPWASPLLAIDVFLDSTNLVASSLRSPIHNISPLTSPSAVVTAGAEYAWYCAPVMGRKTATVTLNASSIAGVGAGTLNVRIMGLNTGVMNNTVPGNAYYLTETQRAPAAGTYSFTIDAADDTLAVENYTITLDVNYTDWIMFRVQASVNCRFGYQMVVRD